MELERRRDAHKITRSGYHAVSNYFETVFSTYLNAEGNHHVKLIMLYQQTCPTIK